MSTGDRGPVEKQVLVAQSAINTTHIGVNVAAHNNLRLVIVGSTGISAGSVMLEGAPTPDYAGTWASVIAAQAAVADTVVVAGNVTTSPIYVRARITIAAVGGTIDVWIVAN